MSYQYKHIRDNSDATNNYEIIGEFPVLFDKFIKQIANQDNSFKIQFYVCNECYGGWFKNCLEFHKKRSMWFCEKSEPADYRDKFIYKNIKSCWANGGYGQMSYFCTLEEEEQNGKTEETNQ